MAKWFIVFAFVFAQGCAFAEGNYGGVIKADAKVYAVAKEEIDDLSHQLKFATGKDFTIDTKDSTTNTGIVIRLMQDSRLNPENDDAALLLSDGKNSLVIQALTKQGIVNGIYTYLDTLGFKWYAPGDAWAYVPQLKDVQIKLNEVTSPDFRLRTFFGTWGTPRNKVIDKDGAVDHAWQQWATRNRMGGGYNLKGHMWNEFLLQNINTLKDHPEYMAQVGGKRVEPNTAAKFCISNTELQIIFVKYMVQKLDAAMKANPNATRYCLSVEPSDGEGDCECDQCKKMGSVSNRVFTLANIVARQFALMSPKAYVNLYAYNTHAAPPDFAVEKNVLVQIIPYGYQSFSSADSMIAAWKKKSDNLFIYDYYGLPIENLDMPLTGDLRPLEFDKRVKYWYAQHITGVTLESSYSIGATGAGLYLFTRLGWHVNADAEKIMKDYYKHCFGKAAKAVMEAEEILSADTNNRDAALKKAAGEIIKYADDQKFEGKQKTCLTYYMAYLHYLKLLYAAYKADAKTAPEATDKLMQFVYGTFFTMMVHNWPVNEWVKTNGNATDYAKEHWDGFKPNEPTMKFKEVVQLREDEIVKLFAGDFK